MGNETGLESSTKGISRTWPNSEFAVSLIWRFSGFGASTTAVRLLLQGQVPSFYYKQLAQEAIAGMAGVDQVVNENPRSSGRRRSTAPRPSPTARSESNLVGFDEGPMGDGAGRGLPGRIPALAHFFAKLPLPLLSRLRPGDNRPRPLSPDRGSAPLSPSPPKRHPVR